jgi:hypothetical protein
VVLLWWNCSGEHNSLESKRPSFSHRYTCHIQSQIYLSLAYLLHVRTFWGQPCPSQGSGHLHVLTDSKEQAEFVGLIQQPLRMLRVSPECSLLTRSTGFPNTFIPRLWILLFGCLRAACVIFLCWSWFHGPSTLLSIIYPLRIGSDLVFIVCLMVLPEISPITSHPICSKLAGKTIPSMIWHAIKHQEKGHLLLKNRWFHKEISHDPIGHKATRIGRQPGCNTGTDWRFMPSWHLSFLLLLNWVNLE